jgi:hypothetical protein
LREEIFWILPGTGGYSHTGKIQGKYGDFGRNLPEYRK